MTVDTRRTDMPLNSPAYYQELRCAIERLLLSKELPGPEILKQTEGAFPLDVLQVLSLLAEDDPILSETAHDLLRKLRGSLDAVEEQRPSDDLLPEPHPLDFDWRFSESCLTFLGHRPELQQKNTVCILGAPSLFRYLAQRGSEVTLYDKNGLAIQRLEDAGFEGAYECDLFQTEMTRSLFDVVMADPPWYVEHYYAFLRVASSVTRCGGHLLLSVLPRLTRSEGSADRQRILELASLAGFDIVEVRPASLTYESPPFERAALLADGFVDLAWRSGDLFVFRKSTRDNYLNGLDSSPNLSDGLWRSAVVDDVVVRVKVERTVASSFSFRASSDTGDYRLHTVSRRSPVRGRINLWTSRNLALSLSRTDCAFSLVEALSKSQMVNLTEVTRGVSVDFSLDQPSILELEKLANLLLVDSRGDSSVHS